MAGGFNRAVVNLALLAAIAGLGVVNWRLATDPAEVAVPVEPAEPGGQAADDSSALSQSATEPILNKDDFKETLARPLFEPSRRPPKATPVEVEPDPPPAVDPPSPPTVDKVVEPSRLSLVGLVKLANGDARALLRPEGEGAGSWVRIGGSIAGWRLVAVDRDAVSIEKDGAREQLRLRPGLR